MFFRTIGGFDVPGKAKKIKKIEETERGRWTDRAMAFLIWLLPLLGLYLDDLLFVSAGICFTASAALTFGRGAALAVAGACLLAYGVVVARARNGGDKG